MGTCSGEGIRDGKMPAMSATRLTERTVQVLLALIENPDTEFTSLELAGQTGLLPGTSYPILLRLQQAGWISARWTGTQPRRRLYRLTPAGTQAATRALARHRRRGAEPARAWCPA